MLDGVVEEDLLLDKDGEDVSQFATRYAEGVLELWSRQAAFLCECFEDFLLRWISTWALVQRQYECILKTRCPDSARRAVCMFLPIAVRTRMSVKGTFQPRI